MDDRHPHRPVRTQAELQQRWQEVLGPDPFEGRSLWLIWFDADGRMLPVVVPIDELPTHPGGQMLDGLAQVARSVLDEQAPDGSVAMLLSRPGSSSVGSQDRDWAQALSALAVRARLRARPLHLATAGSVRVLAVDDQL